MCDKNEWLKYLNVLQSMIYGNDFFYPEFNLVIFWSSTHSFTFRKDSFPLNDTRSTNRMRLSFSNSGTVKCLEMAQPFIYSRQQNYSHACDSTCVFSVIWLPIFSYHILVIKSIKPKDTVCTVGSKIIRAIAIFLYFDCQFLLSHACYKQYIA